MWVQADLRVVVTRGGSGRAAARPGLLCGLAAGRARLRAALPGAPRVGLLLLACSRHRLQLLVSVRFQNVCCQALPRVRLLACSSPRHTC